MLLAIDIFYHREISYLKFHYEFELDHYYYSAILTFTLHVTTPKHES